MARNNKKKVAKRTGGASTLTEYIQKSIVETRYRRPPQADTVEGRQDRPVSREPGPAAQGEGKGRTERWDEA